MYLSSTKFRVYFIINQTRGSELFEQALCKLRLVILRDMRSKVHSYCVLSSLGKRYIQSTNSIEPPTVICITETVCYLRDKNNRSCINAISEYFIRIKKKKKKNGIIDPWRITIELHVKTLISQLIQKNSISNDFNGKNLLA